MHTLYSRFESASVIVYTYASLHREGVSTMRAPGLMLDRVEYR